MYTKNELVITAGDEHSSVEIHFSDADGEGFSLLADDLDKKPVKCLLTLKQLLTLRVNIDRAISYAHSIGYKEP
jgi:hypothetical protein